MRAHQREKRDAITFSPLPDLHIFFFFLFFLTVQEELTRRANRWRLVAPARPPPAAHFETQSVLRSYSSSVTPQSQSSAFTDAGFPNVYTNGVAGGGGGGAAQVQKHQQVRRFLLLLCFILFVFMLLFDD